MTTKEPQLIVQMEDVVPPNVKVECPVQVTLPPLLTKKHGDIDPYETISATVARAGFPSDAAELDPVCLARNVLRVVIGHARSVAFVRRLYYRLFAAQLPDAVAASPVWQALRGVGHGAPVEMGNHVWDEVARQSRCDISESAVGQYARIGALHTAAVAEGVRDARGKLFALAAIAEVAASMSWTKVSEDPGILETVFGCPPQHPLVDDRRIRMARVLKTWNAASGSLDEEWAVLASTSTHLMVPFVPWAYSIGAIPVLSDEAARAETVKAAIAAAAKAAAPPELVAIPEPEPEPLAEKREVAPIQARPASIPAPPPPYTGFPSRQGEESAFASAFDAIEKRQSVVPIRRIELVERDIPKDVFKELEDYIIGVPMIRGATLNRKMQSFLVALLGGSDRVWEVARTRVLSSMYPAAGESRETLMDIKSKTLAVILRDYVFGDRAPVSDEYGTGGEDAYALYAAMVSCISSMTASQRPTGLRDTLARIAFIYYDPKSWADRWTRAGWSLNKEFTRCIEAMLNRYGRTYDPHLRAQALVCVKLMF